MAKQPASRTIKASQLPQQWPEMQDQVARREIRVVVEEGGVPIAAIVSSADLEALKRLDEERYRAVEALERMRAAFKDVPDEELEREVNRAIAEVRAEHRQRAD